MFGPIECCVSLNFFERQHALKPQAGLGLQHLGRLAFLALLESRLALPIINDQARQNAMMELLSSTLTQQDAPFDSFQISPNKVSRQLLSWFDTLTLAGWQGEPLEHQALSRLSILEKLFPMLIKGDCRWSEAMRIERIINMIRSEHIGLHRVILSQPKSLFPTCWQRLLDVLAELVILVDAEPIKTVIDTPKLGCIYRVKTAGALASCTAAAQLWDHYKPTRCLIVSELGELVDKVFNSYKLPTAGFSSENANRLAIQIVNLTCRLFDGSYQFETLYSFLVHPLCPVEYVAAQNLAKKLARNKGFAESGQLILAGLPNDQQAWLSQLDDKTVDFSTKLLQVFTAVQIKCAKRYAVSEDVQDKKLYGILSSKFNSILTQIESQPIRNSLDISRVLEELGLTQQTAGLPTGTVNEKARVEGLVQPGILLEQPQLTIWCGPYSQSERLLPDWHKTEWQSLKQNYQVFSPDELLQLKNYDWQQFLTNVIGQSQQTLIVLEHTSEQATHPLFDEILHQYAPQVIEWSALLKGSTTANLANSLCPAEPERKSLPANSRYVEVGQSIPLTDEMSASRFEKLIFKPSDFVLNYLVNVRKKRLEQVEVDNMLKGNLAHKIFEAFFKEHPNSKQWLNASALLDTWLNNHFRQIAEQYALPLLEAGQHIERLRLQQTIYRALQALLNFFTANQIVNVKSEFSLQGQNLQIAQRDFHLLGNIDFVLTNKHDEVFILDAKWSNGSHKKAKELKEQRAVQLYFYAAAYHQAFKVWPKIGFFIVETAQLLCDSISASFFANSDVHCVETVNTTGQNWQVFEKLASWRFAQLQQGIIELNDPRFTSLKFQEDPSAVQIIESYWKSQQTENARDPYSDYRYLIGWATEGAK